MAPLLDELRFFAGAARVLEGKSAGEYLRDHTSWIRREPARGLRPGHPVELPDGHGRLEVRPGHRGRNAVVLKPSDTTPGQHPAARRDRGRVPAPGRAQRRLRRPGHRPRPGGPPHPQLVSITGSTRAGMEVAAAAAADLKKVHLELGGKAPVIVFDDVDLAATAAAVAGAGYFNAGQDCTAATRVLVHARVAADFTDALAAAAENTRVGGPDDPDAYFGPVNNEAS
ncbi:hypothetical protein GCM10020358_14340 [Amorphoplanes nipponensis]